MQAHAQAYALGLQPALTAPSRVALEAAGLLPASFSGPGPFSSYPGSGSFNYGPAPLAPALSAPESALVNPYGLGDLGMGQMYSMPSPMQGACPPSRWRLPPFLPSSHHPPSFFRHVSTLLEPFSPRSFLVPADFGLAHAQASRDAERMNNNAAMFHYMQGLQGGSTVYGQFRGS